MLDRLVLADDKCEPKDNFFLQKFKLPVSSGMLSHRPKIAVSGLASAL